MCCVRVLSVRVSGDEKKTADIDAIVEECITKLLSVKSQRPGTEVALPGEDIAAVVKRAREVFLAQPMLLEVRFRTVVLYV